MSSIETIWIEIKPSKSANILLIVEDFVRFVGRLDMQTFIAQNLLVSLVLDASLLTTLLKNNRPDSKHQHWNHDQDDLIGSR